MDGVNGESGKAESLRALMAGYQRGEAERFEKLYASLAPAFRRFLTAELRDAARAEDLVQETFLQIHRARHTYDPRLPLEPWVWAIVRHVVLMARRRAARRREAPLPDATELASPASSPEAAEMARNELERALSNLTEKGRGAVLLHHRDGLRFDEVGARLGIGAAAARLQASRGVRLLRAILRGKKR